MADTEIEKILNKTNDFISVLRACQNGIGGGERRRIVEIMVELIEAVWSTLSAPARDRPGSTNNSRLIRDLAELLRSVTNEDRELGHPRYSWGLHGHVSDASPERSDDCSTGDDESALVNRNNVNQQEAGESGLGLMDFDISESEIRDILQFGLTGGHSEGLNEPSETVEIPENGQGFDPPDAELGLPNSLSDFDLAGEQLFVPQSMGDVCTGTFPSLPSVGSDGDWIIPELPQPEGTSLLSPLNTSPPPTVEADVDQSESVDFASPVKEIPDSADLPSREALEMVAMALEKKDLSNIPLDRISSEADFQCAWGSFSGTAVRTLLDQLIQDNYPVREDVIDYFTGKLRSKSRSSDLWVGRLIHLQQPPQTRQRFLVLVEDSPQWSLIEVQMQAAKIVHYKGGTPDTTGNHRDCRSCDEVSDRLQGNGMLSDWIRQIQPMPTWPQADGIWVLWVTRLRADRGNPSEQVPVDYRLRLAREVTWDFLATYNASIIQSAGLLPGPLPTPVVDPAPLEQYWTNFGNEHGFGTRLWEEVRQLAGRRNLRTFDEPVGIERASELLQLALNIAAPDVLLTIKDCLSQLRSQRTSPPQPYPDSPWGAFDALRTHITNESLATIGAKLGMWKLYAMKKEHQDKLVDVILSTKPPSVSVQPGEIQEVLKKDNKGVYWCHLVEHVGNNDPNILPLIPRVVTIGPPHWPRKFTATTYRDIPIWEKKLVGEICAALRPNVLSSIDPHLSKALLYMQDPGEYYPLERIDSESIRTAPLSSDIFVGIMRRTR